jgi:tetratricopeptide (TPR) repeat protein
MRVLSRYERTAEAWSLGEAALARANEPADRDILLRAALAVTVAAGRFEAIASLVERLRSEEHASGVADAADPARRHINLANEVEILRSWTEAVQAIAAAGADRALGPTLDPAVIDASADRVEALAGDDLRASTIVRLARAKRAAALPITDRERASEVLGLFRSAIECATPAPHLVEAELEEAWIAALSLTRSLFPRAREDRLSDEEIAAEDAILASLPESAIAVGVRAARESRSDRRGDLVEAICAASAARPMEVGLLREAVRGLATARSVGEAIALLDERLDRSPAVPEVWQLWTERAIEAGLAEVALERLNRHAATEEPDADPIGAVLRVLPLRALGRESEAAAAEERALERRLPTQRTQMLRVARAIDRAAAGGAHGEAVELLWTLAEELRPSGGESGDAADDGAIRGRIAALDLALRLPSSEDPGGTTDPSDRARLIRRFAEDILTSADRPGVIETIGPAPMIRAAGMLALVVDDLGGDAGGAEDASTQRAAIASRAVALQARTRAELDAPGALPWLTIAQAFADAGRHAAGSDFLAALATSEVRMRPNAAARIATACFALDAAAGGRAERSIALLDLSRARGVRPFAGPERVVDRDADEVYLLAGLYAMVHDQAGARAILKEALRRDPQHAMSMNNLGWDRLEAGEQGDAVITLIEGAYAGRPDDAAILDSIGWLRYKQGRIDEAVELLTRAIAITEGETSLEILDHFGDAAWRHGQRDAARNAWREVVRQAESTYAKEVIVGRLPDYERREHGVVVIDAAALWQRVYGTPRDRARAKLDAIEAGGDPTVADIW